MIPMTLKEIAMAVDGQFNGRKRPEDIQISHIVTDTREKEQQKDYLGRLFIPLKGERFDGHDFIGEAVAKGVSCVLSEKQMEDDTPHILVPSVNEALLELAAYYRRKFTIPVVAVTGSAGKTTTKDIVASVLATKYKTVKTQGNLNNQFGLPFTIFEWEVDTEAAVLEMGMSGFGEIRRLSHIARPDICVITNIGTAHIAHFGSKKEILKAKTEIFDFMAGDGCAILNGDDEMLQTLASLPFSKYFFSINNNSDKMCRCTNVQYSGMAGSSFEMEFNGVRYCLSVPRPGEHMVYNAMAAVIAGNLLGVEKEKIELGVNTFLPSKNRMEILNRNGVTIINDVYNANPDSMKAALGMLCEAAGKKACVLGDMLELGEQGPALHREVGEAAAEMGVDKMICVGSLAKYIYDGAKTGKKIPEVFYYPSKEAFLAESQSTINSLFSGADWTVLIKASRGMAFEDIIEKLRS